MREAGREENFHYMMAIFCFLELYAHCSEVFKQKAPGWVGEDAVFKKNKNKNVMLLQRLVNFLNS